MATEEANYEVVRKSNIFEIRDYSPHIIAGRLPAGRVGRPADIAEVALMLMTNGFITGIALDVKGGGLIA